MEGHANGLDGKDVTIHQLWILCADSIFFSIRSQYGQSNQMAGDPGHVGTAANGKVALWQANGGDGEFSELPMRRLHRNATGVWSANEKA
jgi:hypothetical protein